MEPFAVINAFNAPFSHRYFISGTTGDLQRVVKPISERVCNFLNRAMLYRAHHTRRVAHAAVRHVIARTVRFRRAHAHVRLHNDKVTLRYLCQRQQLLTNAKAAICAV